LPSEAEWEYAARAGSMTSFAWGDAVPRGAANCDGCGSRWDDRQTAPVSSFPANAFGLYDMLGNVWEWTADCWQPGGAGSDVAGPAACREGERRVLRGGSWANSPPMLRSSARVWGSPDGRNNNVGFRVARDP
jgi:formylglycine-generating enzyme required for sulfatase activity